MKLIIKTQWRKKPLVGPVSMDIVFHMPVPGSWSKKKAQDMLGAPHTSKPDLDNMIKLLDVLTGIVFTDDSQIYKIIAKKVYSDKPNTEIFIQCEESNQETSLANGRY